MEDVAIEAEILLHNKKEEEDNYEKVEDNGRKQHQGKEEDKMTGLINHGTSKLVSAGEDDTQEKKDEEAGGIFGHIISNLVSPFSPKAGGVSEDKAEIFRAGGSGTSEGKVQEKEKGNKEELVKIDDEIERVNSEQEGGGGIIDNIASHLPLLDDAAPTSDEASILIHSIVHD